MYLKIAKLAKDKGINIAEISRQTGISETIFSNLKSRGGNLSIENAAKVAKFFEIPLESLVNDDGE